MTLTLATPQPSAYELQPQNSLTRPHSSLILINDLKRKREKDGDTKGEKRKMRKDIKRNSK